MARFIWLLIFFIIELPFAYSLSLSELLNFFSFDFSSSTINLTSSSEIIVDRNGNGINDTIIFELVTENDQGDYIVTIDLIDNKGVSNQSNLTLIGGINSFNISIPSIQLTKSKFNYSIKIFDDDYSLKFQKNNIETRNFGQLESLYKILNISDRSINNSYIQINVTINLSADLNDKIISYLKFNDSIIFSRINANLTKGISNLLFKFNNTILKSTHYIGEYNMTGIKFGQIVLDLDYATSNYDYRDFADTSYFHSLSDYAPNYDNDDNPANLILNVSLDIKKNSTYTVNLYLYDYLGKYIDTLSVQKGLMSGKDYIAFNINGTGLYKKKLNGPYIVKGAFLFENKTLIDSLPAQYETFAYNYSDFKSIDLPDVLIDLQTSEGHNYGQDNVTINISVSNTGKKPAYNLFIDIFDNGTFSKNISKNILLPNRTFIDQFTLTNISALKLTAIADFDNFIEEKNESNNFKNVTLQVNGNPSLADIANLTVNETDIIIIQANPTDDNPSSLIYAINDTRFKQNISVFIWSTDTLDAGNYTVRINVSDGYLSDSTIFWIEVLDRIDLDFDNDGIADSLDRLIGKNASETSSTFNLSFIVDNSTNLSKEFIGSKKIEFKDNNITIMEFNFNFSLSTLNLSNVKIERQTGLDSGQILIRGIRLNEGRTKTVYLDKINPSQNGICIKDFEILNISEISGNCNGENEYKVECDSSIQNGYNCSFIDSISKYRITGLNNSGIVQISYSKPSSEQSLSSSELSNSGTGFGSGSCLERWECSIWSQCLGGKQIRDCIDINACSTQLLRPDLIKECAINDSSELIQKLRDINNMSEPTNKYVLPSITGALFQQSKSAKFSIGSMIVLFVIVLGFLGYIYFLYLHQE
jgi:hypothetical protein